VQFADELFRAKGGAHATQHSFDIYIKGQRGERKPGVFLYGIGKHSTMNYNTGYGQPERMMILAREMAYVAAQKDGPFTEAERARAADIFTKYVDIVNGGESGTVSILAANPFSPAVFNERLGRLPQANLSAQTATLLLESLDVSQFEGIYIPGNIPAADLVVVEDELTPAVKLTADNLDPINSRFFYTFPR
jgi:hypothetical protein